MNASLPNSGSPSMSNSSTTTGLSSLAEPTHHRQHHITKMRDTNKLTSESSSLNFKQPIQTSYTHLIRSHTRKPFVFFSI
jgi:hypothetical protein